MFKSIQQIKDANNNKGHHFFEADTMRYFNSRITTGVLKDRFFITQETGPNNVTMSTLRMACNDGSIETVGKFNEIEREQCFALLNSLPVQYYKAFMYFKKCFNTNKIDKFVDIALVEPLNTKDKSHTMDSFTGACTWLIENAEELGEHCIKRLVREYKERLSQ